MTSRSEVSLAQTSVVMRGSHKPVGADLDCGHMTGRPFLNGVTLSGSPSFASNAVRVS